MICTCGLKFVVNKIGELLIKDGFLYSIDSFKCPECGKTVLGNIPAPMCPSNSERATEIVMAMAARGYNVYGRDI